MQQLSGAFTEPSRSLHAALRTIPDRYQFHRSLHLAFFGLLLAHAASRKGLPFPASSWRPFAVPEAHRGEPRAAGEVSGGRVRQAAAEGEAHLTIRIIPIFPNIFAYFRQER